MAKAATKSTKSSTAKRETIASETHVPLTPELAINAVSEAARTLAALGWNAANIGVVMVWKGRAAGCVVNNLVHPLHTAGLHPHAAEGTRAVLVHNASVSGDSYLVRERPDGSREATRLPRLLGQNGMRALEREGGLFDVYTNTVEPVLVASSLTEADARAMTDAGEAVRALLGCD